MSDASKAVFLSYASQDAEAAQRICDALRAAGVEVWFDLSELVGGDAWDQKIRRQIKECALLIPIISRNTQARTEGYFRLEWRLADQRTHLMAKGRPFLLPVVVDDTRDAEAHVPDSFLEVQWTRLRPVGFGGRGPLAVDEDPALAKFAGRVKRLLEGGEIESPRTRSVPVAEAASTPVPGQGPKWMKRVLASAVIVIAVLAITLKKNFDQQTRTPQPTDTAPPAAPPSVARVWPKDPELRRAIALIGSLDGTLEDYRLADEIVARALEKAPTDPETVTVAARVNSGFVTRSFDFRPERTAAAKRLGERAVQLSPEDPEALYALSLFLSDRAGDPGRAETLARQAIELAPEDPKLWRQLMRAVVQQRPDEGLALAEQNATRFPQDVLTHYDLSIVYRNRRDWEKFERETDTTIALHPLANAINWKARSRLLHNDFPGMKEWVERVPARVRTEERGVVTSFIYALLSGDYDFGLQAFQGFAEPWFNDTFNYSGPAALPQAELLQQKGRTAQAKLRYEAALAELRQHQAANPADMTGRTVEGWILLGLGRTDEAREAFRANFEALRRPYRVGAMAAWWFDAIPAALLCGERETALQLLREAVAVEEGRRTLARRLPSDPRLAAFRDDPEIKALLAEPASAPTAEVPRLVNEKSVAVLAFANLSDDKANEYFSDGISEELLNVLAKVPGLKVSARTSAFYFKGRNTPVPEIAQKLGVAYVVEGSVRKQADKVRITAQLIKAADGFHVWSDTFTRDLKDIFAVQDEIAGLIARNVSPKLGLDPVPATAAVNPEAFELYLRGRQAWNLRSAEGFVQAEQLLHRAIEVAPDFARAHAALADVAMVRGEDLGVFGAFGQRRSPELERIVTQIERTVALDPQLAESHASLGNARVLGWDFAAGERSLRQAIALNPNYATAHQFISFPLFFTGRIDEALAEQRLAAGLDPLSPRLMDNLGHGLRRVGRFREAIAAFDQALALQPNWTEALGGKALACVALGRKAEAVALARRLDPDDPVAAGYRRLALALAGERREAEAALARWTPAGNWSKVQLLLALRRPDQALAALEPSEERLYPEHTDVLLDPLFDPIRGDPRFGRFLASIGWTEAHARSQDWRHAHPPEGSRPSP